MLPVAAAWSSSGVVVIRCILSVLWMTICFFNNGLYCDMKLPQQLDAYSVVSKIPAAQWRRNVFTARRYAKRGIYHRRVSVRPSVRPSVCVCVCVCLSHSGIVSKQLNVGSRK